MKNLNKYFLIAFVVAIQIFVAASPLYAQGTEPKSVNIGNEDVTIVKDYTPVLNDAFKINIVPDGDTSSLSAPKLSYSIDPKPMNSNFNLSPIKPVRIKDDAIKKLYHGFVKAGYGMENMPLLNFYYNCLRAKNYTAGIKYNHLSSTGGINDFGSPNNSNNEIGLFGTRFFDKLTLNGEFNYVRDVVHYYGYKNPPELFSKAETKHLMNDINGSFKIKSNDRDLDKLQYRGGISFYNFNDNRSSTESNVNVSLGGGKRIDIGLITIDASVDVGKIDAKNFDFNRNNYRFYPRLTINKDLFQIIAGVNIAGESEDGSGSLKIYPHLRASYQVINDAFSVYGEITGDLQRNDLRSFSKQNPFFRDNVLLSNTDKQIAISGGTTIKLEHDLMLIASAGYSKLKSMPFFYNEYDTLFPTTFNVVYDDVNLFTVKGSVEYKMAEKITLGANVEFNNYKTDQLKEALYIPTVKFGLNGQYAIAQKIYVKADIFYIGEANAIENINKTPETRYIKLKSFVDVNLGVDYRYSKVLSVFATLNNLGFARYYRYYNYPSYRFNAMAGLTYSF